MHIAFHDQFSVQEGGGEEESQGSKRADGIYSCNCHPITHTHTHVKLVESEVTLKKWHMCNKKGDTSDTIYDLHTRIIGNIPTDQEV